MRLVKIYIIVLCWFCKTNTAQFYFNNRYDNFNNGDINTGINLLGQDYLMYGCAVNSFSFYSLNLGIVNSNGLRVKNKTYNFGSSLLVPNNNRCLINSPHNFIISGANFYKPDTSLVFLWRFDDNLDSLDYKEYGFLNKTNQVMGLIKDPTKYIYMVGWVDSLYKNTDILLIKVDTLGNEVWKKKIGVFGWDETAWCIKISSDGKLLISGNKRAHNGTTNGAYILKADTNGAVMWQQYLWSNQGLAATALIELPNTDIVAIAGKGYGGNTRMELIKLDAAGNLIFDKEYGSFTDRAEPYSMIMNDKGNLVAVGQNYYPSIGGKVNGLMYEFNQNGDSIFSKEYAIQPGSQNYFRDVVQAPDKGYCFSGFITPVYANGGTGNQDIWLLKTDSTFCESAVSCGYPTNVSAPLSFGEALGVRFFPNPAQNEVTFKFENELSSEATIILIDVLGKVLGAYPLPLNSNHEATLNLSDLPNGLYYYTINQPNAANIIGKLTVLK